MKCKRPFHLREQDVLVPCGKCTYCRIVRRREWTLRILHEMQDWSKSCFITLTYEDKYLPSQPVRPVNFPVLPSLSVSDLQRYYKRLRKRVSTPLRHYSCGEYGERGFRPHYHAIIFGVAFGDGPVRKVMQNGNTYFYAEPGHPVYDAWKRGNVQIGFAEPDSVSYCAQYIDKKRYGDGMLFEHYEFRTPEFQLQSIGLGRRYLDREAPRILRRAALLREGKSIGLPRYYSKRLKAHVNPDVRAIDYHRYVDLRNTAVLTSQVALCSEVVPDIGGIPYREMDDDEFRQYVVGLYNRNEGYARNLVAKGEIKNLRRVNL